MSCVKNRHKEKTIHIVTSNQLKLPLIDKLTPTNINIFVTIITKYILRKHGDLVLGMRNLTIVLRLCIPNSIVRSRIDHILVIILIW